MLYVEFCHESEADPNSESDSSGGLRLHSEPDEVAPHISCPSGLTEKTSHYPPQQSALVSETDSERLGTAALE